MLKNMEALLTKMVLVIISSVSVISRFDLYFSLAIRNVEISRISNFYSKAVTRKAQCSPGESPLSPGPTKYCFGKSSSGTFVGELWKN